MSRFERGRIFILDDDVYLTPYPTEEEYFGYILAGPIKQVVSLLDAEGSSYRKWVREERRMAAQFSMPLAEISIPLAPYNPFRALEVAQRIRQLPHPVVVHPFGTDPPLSPAVEALIQAYASPRGLPPLPPSLFKTAMANGKVEVIAPNIAVGPRPHPLEFRSYLHFKGVRSLIFLGPSNSPSARRDRKNSRSAGLAWRSMSAHDELLKKTVASGGPWYLYGPGLRQVQKDLADRFGPPIPRLEKTEPTP
jgi:hypothetical protein